MSSKKILTIGLGGATCGGKSTLARLLGSLFEKSCQKLNQDDFYFPKTYTGHTFIPEFNHINWELESAFDNAKLVKTVGDIVEKSTSATAHSATTSDVENKDIESLIQTLETGGAAKAESLLNAQGTELSPSCQKLFERLELAQLILVVEGIHVLSNNQLFDLCDLKVYVTLDHHTCLNRRNLRSYDPPDPPGYFEKIVWPTYEEQHQTLSKSNLNIHFLDGRKPMCENFSQLLQLVLTHCKAN